MSELSIAFTTVRHRCPHCRRSYAHQATAIKHIGRCFANPAVRTCKTCRHLEPPDPGDWEVGDPGAPAGCGLGVDLSVARCSVCGSEMFPDGSGCPHPEAKPAYGLRVQCELWQATDA